MEAGTLSLSKSATLTVLDVSEWALFLFGAALVAGLIIEYRAVHGSRWIKFGELLVIIGVAGELLGDGGIFLSTRHLQTISDLEIVQLKKKAGDANEKAGKANERAANLEKQAADAEQRTAELLGEIQPRRLSLDQEKDVAELLKLYGGKVVSVATYHQDSEAMILALQIEDALRKAGIVVWDRVGTFGAVGMPLYLGVQIDTNMPDKKLASALCRALETKGGLATSNGPVAFGQGSTMWLPSGPKVPPEKPWGDAFVFVGQKPIAEAPTPATATEKSKTNACH